LGKHRRKSKTSASTDVSRKQFKGVAKPFYKSIRHSYKALDLKLWASDVHSSDRRSTFKALNEKMKVLLKKSEQSLCGDKARRSAEWVEYGKRHPNRKNRIPIDEGRLTSWVHEQRKAFKRNKLAEDRQILLQSSGFIFDARFAYALYLQGAGQPLLLKYWFPN
jgi:hypothetical protein